MFKRPMPAQMIMAKTFATEFWDTFAINKTEALAATKGATSRIG
jgi:hypothetical protein